MKIYQPLIIGFGLVVLFSPEAMSNDSSGCDIAYERFAKTAKDLHNWTQGAQSSFEDWRRSGYPSIRRPDEINQINIEQQKLNRRWAELKVACRFRDETLINQSSCEYWLSVEQKAGRDLALLYCKNENLLNVCQPCLNGTASR